MIKRIIFCLFVFNAILFKSQAQFLDSAFGTAGIVSYTPNSTYGFIYDAGAINSQQKIIVSGSYTSPTNPYPYYTTNIVQRLNSNGTVDNTFNSVVMPPNNLYPSVPNFYFTNIFIQPNQKILLGDAMFRKIIRLNENGTYDYGFGNNGVIDGSVIYPFLNDRGLSAFGLRNIFVTNANKILVCLSALENQETKTVVLRLNENGTMDTTFGNNGVVIQDGFYGNLITQDDSKLVLISQDDSLVINKKRYSSEGLLDISYNNQPLVYTPLNGYSTNFVKAKGKDNNVYIYGISLSSVNLVNIITLIKINQNGEIETTFGTNGVVNESYYSNNNNYYVDNNISFPELLLDANNNIFVACTVSPTVTPVNYNHYIKKFTSNGTVDQSFGINGIVEVELNYSERIRAALITLDNKIMTFGNYQTPNKGIIAQILNNNTLLSIDNVAKKHFKIYPNPVADFLYIDNLKNNNSMAKIFDLNGRLILSISIKNNLIDIKELQTGSYLLKIGDDSQKFIKK
ncbi:T9SS type A sorting domain-containing protein [Chryseobacterium sp. Ch-15]|uniref:T9SS type A sorting domain-containing protein n=1 Tax=Chryseobacterium muglaense TaxID=2893752 RepID=A0A9Q3UV27_9FLAO|nr:T9SS type A sorting domain-containing protein [Chryseobacterium muglaense]MBD3904612.1 T9SS type A sorting domain-containing protein [Chryseobacterium muglaense]MCC9035674.1 T9SS type A sorting domain-containing protein [Chryseobacterium muglaense]MCM2555144.1 T9SS type A sorting domain-containing protein [Chryseobacterium muglaense]